MPSPDSERVRESYNSPAPAPEPVLVTVARENCLLLEERAECIRKLLRLNEQLMGENERVAAAQKAAEQALSGSELEVRELQSTVVALTTQAQHDHKLAQEWQQRANELGTEVEVLRDRDTIQLRLIGDLQGALQAGAERIAVLEESNENLLAEVRGLLRKVSDAATTTVEQITNSAQELADDWYAAEVARLGTPTA